MYEYLQASSGKLIKPNVPPKHAWSGDKVPDISWTGRHIRPTYPFTVQSTGDFEAYCKILFVNHKPFCIAFTIASNTHSRFMNHGLGF